MLKRFTALLLATALAIGTPALSAVGAAQQNQNPTGNLLSIPVAGTVTGTVSGLFAGTATITRFVQEGSNIVAVGTLTGVVRDAAGNVVQSVAATFSAPIVPAQATATCEILNLVLGPIHLDLLGLVIDTNQIVLNITAVPGAGNLLGNLLCSIAGLLDGGGALARIVDLLNQILGQL
jgi:hypothetical protein